MILIRRPGAPIDHGTAVIIDLPHAADDPVPMPQLCSLRNAATHELISGVLAFSLHANGEATRGDGVWIVAEQLVDENDEPLGPGSYEATSAHPEFFQPAVRSALFRYQVAGFTTGPVVDRATGLHPAAGAAEDGSCDTAKAQTRVFKVELSTFGRTKVAAANWTTRDGFVVFQGPNYEQLAAFPVDHVVAITQLPQESSLIVDGEQLRALRSSVLWELERTSAPRHVHGHGEYRRVLRALADKLGVGPADDESAGVAHHCDAPHDDTAAVQAALDAAFAPRDTMTPCR